MATPTISDYFADAAHWTEHRPNYVGLHDAFAHNAPNNPNARQVSNNICGISNASPTALAIVIQGSEDYIYIVTSPSVYHADPLNATAFDDNIVVLNGNDLGTAIPLVLPQEAFQLTNNTRCLTLAEITGVNGHGAAPPTSRHGPHAPGTANTEEIRYRRALLLPAQDAALALTTSPNGRYTLIGFYNTFIAPKVADPDADVQAIGNRLSTWYRIACTNTTAGSTNVAVAPITSGDPIVNQRLNTHAQRVKSLIQNKLGLGGPQLTTVAFQQGIAALSTRMQDNTDQRIAYDRDARDKSFTDKHGDAMAAQVHRLCNVTDDAGLPAIHGLLAKAPKSKEYSIIECAFHSRLLASPVGLHAGATPLPTTQLVDTVFRRYRPSSTGQTFGQGLTPFAMICEGHPEMHEQKALMQKASMAESGASMSLEDAQTILSSDMRLPTNPNVAQEKLQAWSIAVDVFHGDGHPVAANVRNFVQSVGPMMHRVALMAPDDKYGGMDMVWRILYEAQQEYFAYVNSRANDQAALPPTFNDILQAVNTHRVQKLSPLPALWYSKIKATETDSNPTGSNQETSPRARTSAAKRTNARANRALMKRYSESGHSSINAMVQGHDVTYPKYRDKPVCLSWALKGECNEACKRKFNHVTYPTEVNKKIHELMDTCGVATLES